MDLSTDGVRAWPNSSLLQWALHESALKAQRTLLRCRKTGFIFFLDLQYRSGVHSPEIHQGLLLNEEKWTNGGKLPSSALILIFRGDLY